MSKTALRTFGSSPIICIAKNKKHVCSNFYHPSPSHPSFLFPSFFPTLTLPFSHSRLSSFPFSLSLPLPLPLIPVLPPYLLPTHSTSPP